MIIFQVSDIKWLSVWCRKFAVDFGNLMFPAEVKVRHQTPLMLMNNVSLKIRFSFEFGNTQRTMEIL